MNLKLLEKLVRLANNNPNENESNLAARRACKLIEAANFKFVQDVVTVKSPVAAGGTWNDVKRSEEPQWQSTVYDEYRVNPDLDYIFEFFRKRTENQPKDKRWDNIPKPESNPNPQKPFNPFEGSPYEYSGFDFGRENPFTEFRGGRRAGKTQREKRPLNCHRCGKEYQTGFVGPPQMFTCNECHWAIYREEQEAKKNEPSRSNK